MAQEFPWTKEFPCASSAGTEANQTLSNLDGEAGNNTWHSTDAVGGGGGTGTNWEQSVELNNLMPKVAHYTVVATFL